MSEPTYDDERVVRTALATLLVDEPAPRWSVSDDVARGRRLRARRRTRWGAAAGLAVVAVVAVGLVAPLVGRSPHATPFPAGSGPSSTASASWPPLEVNDYLRARGWAVASSSVALRPDGTVSAASLALESLTGPPRTSVLQLRLFDEPRFPRPSSMSGVGWSPEWARQGGLLAGCGTACTTVHQATVDTSVSEACFHGSPCTIDYTSVVQPVVTSRLQGGSVILARVFADGTEVDALSSPPLPAGSPMPVPTLSPAPFPDVVPASAALSADELSDVVDLIGQPRLRASETTSVPVAP